MLRIASADEIGGLLLELPALFRLQEQRSVEFPARTREWLSALEQTFTANRLYQAGLVAALRSDITSAEQGQLPPDLQFRGRVTRSKAMGAMASRALQGAAEIASAIMAENGARFAEAERVSSQIVATARSRGELPAREPKASDSQYLRGVRHAFASIADLDMATTHLEGLVGPQDALAFLDRALGPAAPGGEE